MLFDKDLDTNKKPSYETIYPYLLYALHKEGGVAHGTKIVARVGILMKLTEEVLEERSGQQDKRTFEIAVRVSMSHLRITKHIEPKDFKPKDSDGTGYWYLSKKGEETIKLLKEDEGNEYDWAQSLRDEIRPIIDQRLKHNEEKRKGNDSIDSEDDTSEYDNRISDDLEKIKQMDPFAFERLCIQLLKAMGWVIEETKKSCDNGVDGIGYIEIGFVKFKVVMQAKRFKEDKVQGTHIRNFLGSINVKHAEKSIFITTSDFSQKANNLGNDHSVTLINGYRLIELLRENKIDIKPVNNE